jgi:cytochrome c oxidase subunit 3
LISPFTKHFTRNFSIWDTEVQAKLYINLMLNATLILAILFMAFQVTEYFISPVNINTGIYGSTFYMITGLHGAHVFIGTCFLFYCRIAVSVNWNTKALMVLVYWVINSFFHVIFPKKISIDEEDKPINRTTENTNPVDHYGRFGIESFESAAWYWHFVDVVWIFVFGFVYVWSHLTVLDQQ